MSSLYPCALTKNVVFLRNFPNCLFGESCLFIHPKCKFDTTCTRKSCPFTHSSLQSKPVISIVPMTVPVKLHPQSLPVVNGKTVCKYFPACNNVSCSFFHPTVRCKFKHTICKCFCISKLRYLVLAR